jgi:hypothetical protein
VITYNSFHDFWACYGLWNAIEVPLKICQTAAFLEVRRKCIYSQIYVFLKVIHAMLGLVRSNPMIVLIQIISRVFLVWGVANYIPHVRFENKKKIFFETSFSFSPNFQLVFF